MRVLVKKVNEFLEKVGRDHVGAYAAQSAFFLVLYLIPNVLLQRCADKWRLFH